MKVALIVPTCWKWARPLIWGYLLHWSIPLREQALVDHLIPTKYWKPESVLPKSLQPSRQQANQTRYQSVRLRPRWLGTPAHRGCASRPFEAGGIFKMWWPSAALPLCQDSVSRGPWRKCPQSVSPGEVRSPVLFLAYLPLTYFPRWGELATSWFKDVPNFNLGGYFLAIPRSRLFMSDKRMILTNGK